MAKESQPFRGAGSLEHHQGPQDPPLWVLMAACIPALPRDSHAQSHAAVHKVEL